MKNYAGMIVPVQAAAALFCFILSPVQTENSKKLFSRIDLFTGFSLSTPFDEIHDKTDYFSLYRECTDGSHETAGWNCRNIEDAVKLCSVSATAGIRVSFSDCEIRLYDALPPATFAALGEISDPGAFRGLLAAPRYGASLSLPDYLHIPFVLQAGTLIPGGTWTRLSSPELSSSVSPFTTTFASKEGLSISLPGASSGEKPPAGAFSAGVPETCGLFKGSTISFFYRNDGTYAASAVCCINFPRMIRTAFSLTGEHFFLSNMSSSWFTDTNFFHAGWFPALSSQALFSSPAFQSLLIINGYEQPSAVIRYTFRSENKLTFGRFKLLFAGFAADGKDIRCTDNSLLTTLGQFHFRPQYTWRFASPRLPSLTTGASCLFQHKYDRSTSSEYNEIKCTLGTQYTDRQISAGLTFCASDSGFLQITGGNYEKPEYTVSARFSGIKKYFRSTTSGTYTFSDSSSKESFKLSLTVQNKKKCTSGSAVVSCRQKDFKYKDGTASLVFSTSFLSKLLKYTVRFTMLGTF
jgi:hypothetical protein